MASATAATRVAAAAACIAATSMAARRMARLSVEAPCTVPPGLITSAAAAARLALWLLVDMAALQHPKEPWMAPITIVGPNGSQIPIGESPEGSLAIGRLLELKCKGFGLCCKMVCHCFYKVAGCLLLTCYSIFLIHGL